MARLLSWPKLNDLEEHLRAEHGVTDGFASMVTPLTNTAGWSDWHNTIHEPEGWTGPNQDQPNRPPELTHMHPATGRAVDDAQTFASQTFVVPRSPNRYE